MKLSNTMKELSHSPDRYTFQLESYIKRRKELGEIPDPEYLQILENSKMEAKKREIDSEWQKNNLEYDLRTDEWILTKVRENEVYAQNLYAAMCNMQWVKGDKVWSCSWRYAGGIIANMLQKGDYIDWYCSGIKNGPLSDDERKNMTPEAIENYDFYQKYFVGEGYVTREIAKDLEKLGWIPKEWEEDESSN